MSVFNRTRIELHFSPSHIPGINTLGRLNYSKAHPPLKNHDHKASFEICYLYKGQQTYQVGNEKFVLKGGDIYITFPYETHSTGGSPEEKSILYWVIFEIAATDTHFLQLKSTETVSLYNSLISIQPRVFRGSAKIKSILDEIILTYYNDVEFKDIRIRQLFIQFFLLITDLACNKTIKPLSKNMGMVIAYIKENTCEDMVLEDLASMINLSLSRFKQRFKEEIGIPPREYILREKVEKARELITEHNYSITDAAYNLGFSSSQYFATVFKRFTGFSPGKLKY